MRPLTWLRVGGPAQYLLTPRSESELLEVLQTCRTHGIPVHILGSGSNLLVRDAGVRGAVVRVTEPVLAEITIEETQVTAGSGTLLSRLVTEASACRPGRSGTSGGHSRHRRGCCCRQQWRTSGRYWPAGAVHPRPRPGRQSCRTGAATNFHLHIAAVVSRTCWYCR